MVRFCCIQCGLRDYAGFSILESTFHGNKAIAQHGGGVYMEETLVESNGRSPLPQISVPILLGRGVGPCSPIVLTV